MRAGLAILPLDVGAQWLSAAFGQCSDWSLCTPCRRLVYVRAAGPITVTVLSIAICNIFKLYKGPHKIAVVGSIPQVLRAVSPCACPDSRCIHHQASWLPSAVQPHTHRMSVACVAW